MTEDQFKYVCALCKCFMGGDVDSPHISHTICDDCKIATKEIGI